MTLEQKQAIAALRLQGIGYDSVAGRLGISVNTVKSYCRRNSLSTTVLSGGTPAKGGRPKRSHDCAAKKDKAPAECEVTLSYFNVSVPGGTGISCLKKYGCCKGNAAAVFLLFIAVLISFTSNAGKLYTSNSHSVNI